MEIFVGRNFQEVPGDAGIHLQEIQLFLGTGVNRTCAEDLT